MSLNVFNVLILLSNRNYIVSLYKNWLNNFNYDVCFNGAAIIFG